MPRLNSRGDWCAGIGGGVITVNGVTVIPYQSGSANWLDDDHVVGQHCGDACRVVTWNRIGGAVATVLDHGANAIEAGGGVWAVWFGTTNPPNPNAAAEVGITTSYGARFPSSGLGPVGPDGALALKVDYQSAGPWDVLERDGSRWRLTDGDAGNINLLGQRRAVWTDWRGVVSVNMPAPTLITSTFWWLRVFAMPWELGTEWWVLYQVEDGRLVMHPFTSTLGYVVASGNTFRPDAMYLPNGVIRVVWSLSEGEPAHDVHLVDIPLTQARVELKPVVPPDRPIPPEQPKPKILVEHYDSLMKAGETWLLDFSNSDGTSFLITKDDHDQLWIEAENSAGTDHTATVRQLTVEGPDAPDPPDTPMPVITQRFWCHPNIGSTDLLAIFDHPEQLGDVQMFGLYVQCLLSDESTEQLGPNIYPNLIAHDVFNKLVSAGVPLTIEMGSVKQGDCHAQNAIAGMQTALQRVVDAGGEVACLSMDEPLTANQQYCGNDLSACADAVAAFIHSVASIDPGIAVGWIEAWPEVSIADHATFLSDLKDRHALPSYWHPDIDWERARREDRDPALFIHHAQELADQYGITLGVMVNSTIDPIATDADHRANLLALSTTLHGIYPDAPHVVVQSWAFRTGGTQDVPHNLGAVGLLKTFADVRAQFDPTTPPEPPTPGVSMLYATLIEPTAERGPVAVKEVKPVPNEPNIYTLILPDDRVFSLQPPDGTDGIRPSGTVGQYEKCTVSGNAATFRPVPDKVFTRFFALVASL